MAKPKKNDSLAPVILTNKAVDQLKIALTREKAPESGVRVLLVNAGNGYRYDLQIEEKAGEEDHVSNQGGLTIFIDKFAARYLEGTSLDYYESPAGSGFIFERAEADS